MKEQLTQALVLEKRGIGEADAVIVLFTEDFGRVSARAKGVRRITSKLRGHLEPLCFSSVRLVSKNSFQIADALRFPGFDRRISKSRLGILDLVRRLTAENQPEPALWRFLKAVFLKDGDFVEREEKRIVGKILGILGFEPKEAVCSRCGAGKPENFLVEEGIFLCRRCLSLAKYPKNEKIEV